MSRLVKPLIIIGMDKYSNEIVQDVYSNLCSDDRQSKITSYLLLDSKGEITDCNNNCRCSLKGLISEQKENVYSQNFDTVQKKYIKNIEIVIINEIEKVKNRKVVLELLDDGWEVEDKVQIELFSTLFDPIGSSLITAFLSAIQNIKLGRLKGINIHIDFFGFFPDIFDEYKDDEKAYIRSYICLQELDYILDNPDVHLVSNTNRSLCNNLYLFSSKNENCISIVQYKDLIILISKVLAYTIHGLISSDASYEISLVHKVEGKTTRYSSFGYSMIFYPSEAIMELGNYYYSHNILDTYLKNSSENINCYRVADDVGIAFNEMRICDIDNVTERDIENNIIWSDFRCHGIKTEYVSDDTYEKTIREQHAEFERISLNDYKNRFDEKIKSIFANYKNYLDKKASKLLDNLSNGIDTAIQFFEVYTGSDLMSTPEDGDNLGSLINNNIINIENEFVLEERVEDNACENENVSITEREKFKKYYSLLTDHVRSIESKDELNTTSKEITDSLVDLGQRIKVQIIRCSSLNKDKKVFLQKYVVFIPLIVICSVILLSYLISTIFKFNFFIVLGRTIPVIFPIALVVYSILVLWKYKTKINDVIRKEESILNGLKSERESKSIELEHLYNEFSKKKYSYYTKTKIFEFLIRHFDYATEIVHNLREFKDLLIHVSEDSDKSWDAYKIKTDTYEKSLMKTDEAKETIISCAQDKKNDFFIDNATSKYYTSFVADKNIQSLLSDLATAAANYFSEVKNVSISSYIENIYHKNGISKAEQISSYVNLASPGIYLDIEKSEDVSQKMIFFGLNIKEHDELSKEIKTVINNYELFDIERNDEMILIVLKVGFPAYHIALVKYGGQLLQDVQISDYQICPDWALERLEPLSPLVGKEDSIAKNIIYIARALGIITNDSKNNMIYSDMQIHSLNEFEDMLCKNKKLAHQIQDDINEIKKIDNAVEIIENYIRDNDLRGDEKRILQNTIDDINQIT